MLLALNGTGVGSAAGQLPTIPEPQVISLETSDNVVLQCTYYPGGYYFNQTTKQVVKFSGKEVVPIIMLHGWDGQRREFDALASYLQKLGHAVVVPDLRGHGGSTALKFSDKPIEPERMKTADINNMVLDVDAVKKFLLDKNNQEELNIELLCVLGAQMGAIQAVNWAARDWSWPQLPSFKQGRDVKTLILLSPAMSFKGTTPNKALQHPAIQKGLSVLIAVGKRDRSGYDDARKIYGRLERLRGITAEDNKGLQLYESDTSVSGTRLLAARGIGTQISLEIAGFVYRQVVSKKADLKWTDRKSPLSE